MEPKVDSWNDDRLDELSRRMDDGFKEMREGFEKCVSREEMKELIVAINTRFEQADRRFERVASREEMSEVRAELRHLDNRFEQINGRLDRFLNALLVGLLGFAATVVAAAIGLSMTT